MATCSRNAKGTLLQAQISAPPDSCARSYCDARGAVTLEANPNGSVAAIAGICDSRRNVVGLMPHPERASESDLGSIDGRIMWESLLAMAQA